jgi:putative ABC transport system permease protein
MSAFLRRPDTEKAVESKLNLVTPNYTETLGMTLAAGRPLPDAPAEGGPRRVLVNETLVQAMGWDGDPVGRRLAADTTSGLGRPLDGAEVVGVVKDFHFSALYEPIEPLVLASNAVASGGVGQIAVRLRPEADLQAATEALREVWSDVAPEVPFDYAFLDEDLDAQYRAEQRWQRIMTLASSFALAIAALGLFGLATLATARRTKEIGIRKALGASVARLLALLSKDFLQLVALAFLLGAPAAYLGATRWLEGFAYRVDLTGAAFIGAGLAVLVVAAVAVGTQALRSARANPVDALRQE